MTAFSRISQNILTECHHIPDRRRDFVAKIRDRHMPHAGVLQFVNDSFAHSQRLQHRWDVHTAGNILNLESNCEITPKLPLRQVIKAGEPANGRDHMHGYQDVPILFVHELETRKQAQLFGNLVITLLRLVLPISANRVMLRYWYSRDDSLLNVAVLRTKTIF